MPRFVVSGTDTGVGKTIFCAALTGVLDGYYWKPVQSGLEEETDSETVARLSNLPAERILPEAYRLTTPASPHASARTDGVTIAPERLVPPRTDRTLVIEGAGGLLVPLSDQLVFADLFHRWQLPVILCARTTLGTINHSLLSIEALKRRGVNVLGIAFTGDENRETQRIITDMGEVPALGRLPQIPVLSAATLRTAFCDHFDLSVFQGEPA
jgi:dethiobiotin synthetase